MPNRSVLEPQSQSTLNPPEKWEYVYWCLYFKILLNVPINFVYLKYFVAKSDSVKIICWNWHDREYLLLSCLVYHNFRQLFFLILLFAWIRALNLSQNAYRLYIFRAALVRDRQSCLPKRSLKKHAENILFLIDANLMLCIHVYNVESCAADTTRKETSILDYYPLVSRFWWLKRQIKKEITSIFL